MRLRNPNPNEWWSKATPTEKALYRGLIVIGMDLLDGETMVLACPNQELSFAVLTSNPRTRAGKLIAMPDTSPDQWWTLSSPLTRTCTCKLAMLMEVLPRFPDKALCVINRNQTLAVNLLPNPLRPAPQPSAN